MSSSKYDATDFKNILGKVKDDNKSIRFIKSKNFYWSPAEQVVHYGNGSDPFAVFALLHELSHALLSHQNYQTDIELLRLEAEAWAKAVMVAKEYSVTISDDHIQDCLDTYRDWLHKRSTCPTCKAHGLQNIRDGYICLNCSGKWQVTNARFCRVYRKKA